jgi:hypothetical protein
MDNVIEALGRGKKKQGRGFDDIKQFVKKHHGKLAAVAGALGTIGTIALLSGMSGKKKPENLEVAVETPSRSRASSASLDRDELEVARELGLLPREKFNIQLKLPPRVEEKKEDKFPKVILRPPSRDEEKKESRKASAPIPLKHELIKDYLKRTQRRPSTSLLLAAPLPQTPPEPVKRIVPQAVPITRIKGPPPAGPPPSMSFIRRLPSLPEKKGQGKKKKPNISLLKKVMNYKVNNNVSLKEAWKAVRGY